MHSEGDGFAKLFIKACWYILYWSTYLMCWTVLPILMAYLDNGYFSFKDKFIYGIKYNIYYYLIAAAAGIVILVIMKWFQLLG